MRKSMICTAYNTHPITPTLAHFPDYFEEVKEALVANHVVLKPKEINE